MYNSRNRLHENIDRKLCSFYCMLEMFVYETAIVQAVISTGEVGEVPGKVEGARAEMPREQLLQPMHHCTCIRAGDHGWGEGDVAAPVHAAENIVQRYLKPALLVIWVK